MCDATRMTVLAELIPPGPYLVAPPCDACPWPLGHVLCFSPETGCFVLCKACAERLQAQTAVAGALALAAAYGRRGVRLI
jgi:hypothetical protein